VTADTAATVTSNDTNLGEPVKLPAVHHTDNTRLEAFSDAIFGFAATLLVVSLDVPSTYEALVRSLYGFVAFGLSFAMLVGIWAMHRDFFRRYPLGDTRTVLLNTALLFLVLFYVYPLKFLTRLIAVMLFRGHFGGDTVTIQGEQLGGMFTIYGFGWAAVFVCLALMYLHAAREAPRVGFSGVQVSDAYDRFGAFLVMSLLGIVSAGFAMANIGVRYGVPGWMYALNGPALSLYWVWRHRKQAAAASTTAE
jgi:uncharacterized membrane protein